MLRFPCPQCRKTIAAPPNFAGRQVQCPLCESVVPVPMPAQQAAPVQPVARPTTTTPSRFAPKRRNNSLGVFIGIGVLCVVFLSILISALVYYNDKQPAANTNKNNTGGDDKRQAASKPPIPPSQPANVDDNPNAEVRVGGDGDQPLGPSITSSLIEGKVPQGRAEKQTRVPGFSTSFDQFDEVTTITSRPPAALSKTQGDEPGQLLFGLSASYDGKDAPASADDATVMIEIFAVGTTWQNDDPSPQTDMVLVGPGGMFEISVEEKEEVVGIASGPTVRLRYKATPKLLEALARGGTPTLMLHGQHYAVSTAHASMGKRLAEFLKSGG